MDTSPIECPPDVVQGSAFTKEFRQGLHGRVAGGGGSRLPEVYQRERIILGTRRPCPPTQTRINYRKNEMISISHPMTNDDGFDYTENFDGKQTYPKGSVWINLKSVVGKGGSQTRTLRDECYRFVEAQLDYLVKSGDRECFFANIFDGDEACAKMSKFNYLLALPEFAEVRGRVYVGDLRDYFAWVSSVVC